MCAVSGLAKYAPPVRCHCVPKLRKLLVVLKAEWCGFCKAAQGLLEQMDRDGELPVQAVLLDDTAMQRYKGKAQSWMKARGFPHMTIQARDGKQSSSAGYRPKDKLLELIGD